MVPTILPIQLKNSNKRQTQNNLKTIKIKPGTIHAIKNIGEDDMVLIVYANESFDPEDPDTYYEEILE